MIGTIQTVFGLTLTELGLVAVAAGYVVSLIKDWRPVRTLRRENDELRDSLKRAQRRIDQLDAKVSELEKASVPVLERQLVQVAENLDRVVTTLDRLDGSVRASVAAVELLSKQSLLDDALDRHGTTPA